MNNSKNLLSGTDGIYVIGELENNRFSYGQKKNYQYLNMIGKGGVGKVWKVKHLHTGKSYALKEMSKATYYFMLLL